VWFGLAIMLMIAGVAKQIFTHVVKTAWKSHQQPTTKTLGLSLTTPKKPLWINTKVVKVTMDGKFTLYLC
jgi:hypothetical protein